jgi:hypothetical protein
MECICVFRIVSQKKKLNLTPWTALRVRSWPRHSSGG